MMQPLIKFITLCGAGVVNGVRFLFVSLYKAIRFILTSIYQVFRFIFVSLFNVLKFIVVGIYKIFVATGNMCVRFINWTIHTAIRFVVACAYYFKKIFIIPFLPSYKVIFSLYQVIPGFPVNRSESVHVFEKGHGAKAKKFYNDVVQTTKEKKIVPSEAVLIRRKKVVAIQRFGPVGEIRKMSIPR